MSRSFQAVTTVQLPREQVWGKLTDWENAHRWMPGIEWLTAEGETQKGTRLTFSSRGKERPSSIVECHPGQLIVLQSKQGGVTADYEYKFASLSEDSTQVTLTAYCSTQGLLWGIASPFLRLAIRLTDGGQLKAFKKMAEGTKNVEQESTSTT